MNINIPDSKGSMNKENKFARKSLQENSFILSKRIGNLKNKNEKIVQNNCQNIYNLNINQRGKIN